MPKYKQGHLQPASMLPKQHLFLKPSRRYAKLCGGDFVLGWRTSIMAELHSANPIGNRVGATLPSQTLDLALFCPAFCAELNVHGLLRHRPIGRVHQIDRVGQPRRG